MIDALINMVHNAFSPHGLEARMKRTPMKGQTIHSIPGFLTPTQAMQRLGMSRQLFYQSKLADALDKYTAGRNVVLYKEADVDDLAHWLRVRKGLMALGVLNQRYPLAPTEEEYRAALAGQWDAACPVCGGEAVLDPDTGRIWCPEHGVVESEAVEEAKDEQ